MKNYVRRILKAFLTSLRGKVRGTGRWAKLLLKWFSLQLGARVLRVLRLRFLGDASLQSSWSRIGHLAIEPDCFIKEGLLGRRPFGHGIIVAPAEMAANRCLLDYWRRYLWVVTSPRWCGWLAQFASRRSLRWSVKEYASAINRSARFGAIQAAWGNRPPLLRLTAAHRAAGATRLRQLGLPARAWFVCCHCREGGYDKNDPHHSLRNCRIEDYLPAMRAIVTRGGWCLRMGDTSMKPLPPQPGIIDYAHSPLRCDWMDIFLCASCRFFLGGASGLCLVATVFGVPSAVANQALPVLTQPIGSGDLLIPKLLWSSKLGRYLTFPEIAASPFANARLTHCFEHTGIEVRDNDPQDILDLALEMLADLEGTFREDADDRRLQAAFAALVRPGHYSYGAVSRFGRCFMRKYRHLLGPPLAEPAEFRGALPGCGTLQCACLPADWLPDAAKVAA